jgi:prophage regulatory protein
MVEKRVIRLKEVELKTGLPRSTIYRQIKAGKFPRQFLLGGSRSVGWWSSEVDEWLDAASAGRALTK